MARRYNQDPDDLKCYDCGMSVPVLQPHCSSCGTPTVWHSAVLVRDPAMLSRAEKHVRRLLTEAAGELEELLLACEREGVTADPSGTSAERSLAKVPNILSELRSALARRTRPGARRYFISKDEAQHWWIELILIRGDMFDCEAFSARQPGILAADLAGRAMKAVEGLSRASRDLQEGGRRPI